MPWRGSLYSIYANLYNRVMGAKLTHGIRGVLWHQRGEQQQGAAASTGDLRLQVLSAILRRHVRGLETGLSRTFSNYYISRSGPRHAGDTSRNDQLREKQRALAVLYSNMRHHDHRGHCAGIASCRHYEPAGYQVFSDLWAR